MRQVGRKIVGSGNKTILVLQKRLKTRTFICCFSLWAAAEGQHPRDFSLPPFSLDVLIQHLAKKEHRDQKISTALLGTIYFCNRSPSPHPNQMVLQSPGERIQCQTKNVSLQLLPQQQRAAWLMKLCQANCSQHDAVGQHSFSRTHTSDCGRLMDSPKESFPITGTPIREASATKILFVASKIVLPQRSSWVWRCSRRSLLFCCSPAKALTQDKIYVLRVSCKSLAGVNQIINISVQLKTIRRAPAHCTGK